MKHKSCRALYEYWDRLRDGERAPARSAIEPSAISEHLRDTFILEASVPSYPFRLAGTRLCAVLGSELRATSFVEIWSADDRNQIDEVLAGVSEEGVGAVLGVSAQGRPDHRITLELLLLPLVQSGPHFDRILGALMPMQMPYWLGVEPLKQLRISSSRQFLQDDASRTVDVLGRPPMSASVVPAYQQPMQRRSRFFVVEGGKS